MFSPGSKCLFPVKIPTQCMESALVTFPYHHVIATLSFSVTHTLPCIKGMELVFAFNLKGSDILKSQAYMNN